MERFPCTLEGIGERSKDSGSVAEKTSVEVDHAEESLKSRFILGQRKISNGGGVLLERVKTGTGYAMAEEFGLGNGKLTFAQANRHRHGTAPGRLGDAEHEKLSRG